MTKPRRGSITARTARDVIRCNWSTNSDPMIFRNLGSNVADPANINISVLGWLRGRISQPTSLKAVTSLTDCFSCRGTDQNGELLNAGAAVSSHAIWLLAISRLRG